MSILRLRLLLLADALPKIIERLVIGPAFGSFCPPIPISSARKYLPDDPSATRTLGFGCGRLSGIKALPQVLSISQADVLWAVERPCLLLYQFEFSSARRALVRAGKRGRLFAVSCETCLSGYRQIFWVRVSTLRTWRGCEGGPIAPSACQRRLSRPRRDSDRGSSIALVLVSSEGKGYYWRHRSLETSEDPRSFRC
jgi:hypothetical protein